MVFDGLGADVQPPANFAVGQALGQQGQDFGLALGQQLRCARAGMGGDAKLAQQAGGLGHLVGRSNALEGS